MHYRFKHVPKRYERQANAVLALAPKMRAMSDEQLHVMAREMKREVQAGKSLDAVKIEAYAMVREADRRVLGLEPFPVQVVGALVMQDGNVAEMKTGEGKTLTATMPMFLNGLTGPGNFLVTANDYLAARDAKDMGRVYRWLGLTVASGVAEVGEDPNDRDMQAIYNSDIVYTTNATLGFDYLIDNLAGTKAETFMQGFRYALIDEVDAVLLDSASMPLVIAGAPKVRSNLFELANHVVELMAEDTDYEFNEDHTKVWFTPAGIRHMEEYMGIDGLLEKAHETMYRHLVLALKAHYTLTRDRDYVVDEDGVSLLDLSNGRKLAGMRLEAGLHQAIEAKEKVPISNQTRSMASITFQNLFRMFSHLGGMTGTAKTDAAELQETYRLRVVEIPTNKPNIRKDDPDQLFLNTKTKLAASLKLIKKAYAAKRPVLVETGSVTMSNLYSRLLLREGIPHNLLNARSAAKEAQIVKEAGQAGTITVATSMAGRGTDIRLGEGVEAKGGLLVVGTERMGSARVDNQLRGRAGRQGSPGESIFYVSLEDPVLLHHGPKWLRRYRVKQRKRGTERTKPFSRRRFKRLIKHAQKASEQGDRSSRLRTLQYGEIMRVQRATIYAVRRELMDSSNLDAELASVQRMAIKAFTADHPDPTHVELSDFVLNTVDNRLITADTIDANWRPGKKGNTPQFLASLITKQLAKQHALLPHADQQLYFDRMCLLKALDNAWIEQVDMLKQLESIANGRSTTRHDPLLTYLMDGQKSFEEMKADFATQAVRNLLLSEMSFKEDGTIEVQYP